MQGRHNRQVVWRRSRIWARLFLAGLAIVLTPVPTLAQDATFFRDGGVDVKALLQAGGVVGWVIVALSIAMVALIVEHLLSIRRGSLMPGGLAEELHQSIAAGKIAEAENVCRNNPSFLGFVVGAGLADAGLGYNAVEKSMEDASAEQAARLFRKIEYLSVIGTLAPMLGLMGTVWGMIQAFGEFTQAAVPQPADFAPGISHALVTTLMGLVVAVPALAAYAMFRNRIDEYVAETSLLAEHVVNPLKRSLIEQRQSARRRPPAQRPAAPQVAVERRAQ